MTEYIPAVLSGTSVKAILAHATLAEGKPVTTVTKKALKRAVAEGMRIEYISRSQFHRYGSWFTGQEAVAVYGPVGVEVRHAGGSLIAVVEYAPHPVFGSAPVHADVAGVVQ